MPKHLAEGFNIIQSKESLKSGRRIFVKFLPETFEYGIKDSEWIPLLGKEGSCIITQDINISRRKDELDLYKKHGIGIFFLRGKTKKQGLSIWEMVEALSKNWNEITRIVCEEDKPFAYQFYTSSKMKKL